MVNGNGQACGTYHWQTTWPAHNCSYPQGHESVHKCKSLPSDWGKTPHEFAVEHTADYLAFVVDSQTIVNTSTTSPAKPLFWPMPFFLILNTAIGGEGTWASPPSSDTTFPTFHRIDYVRSNRRVPLKTDTGPLYATAALLLLSASASAEVRVEGAGSVEACMAAAGGAGEGEPTVCTLASGVLRPSATPHLTPPAPLRGPVTVRGAASGEPTTLSGALPVPSHGWELDASADGKPIFVTTLPEPLRTTEAGTAPVQVFVDDVFISGKPQRL